MVEETPYHVLTMPIKTEDYDPDSDAPSGLYVLLRITHTPKYPDEIPKLEIEESDNMTEEDLDEFQNHLNEIVSIRPFIFYDSLLHQFFRVFRFLHHFLITYLG